MTKPFQALPVHLLEEDGHPRKILEESGKLWPEVDLLSDDRNAVDWPALIQRGLTFSVEARLKSCPSIPSTRLITTRLKDAICDAVMDAR